MFHLSILSLCAPPLIKQFPSISIMISSPSSVSKGSFEIEKLLNCNQRSLLITQIVLFHSNQMQVALKLVSPTRIRFEISSGRDQTISFSSNNCFYLRWCPNQQADTVRYARRGFRITSKYNIVELACLTSSAPLESSRRSL